MRILVPDILSNLSHSAPALRKSALDSLRKYLKHSRNYDDFLLKLISTEEDNVVTAAPFLISRKTTESTLKQLLDHLWEKVNNVRPEQENVAKSLARIRYILGGDRFKLLMGPDRYKELQKICDKYGLPFEYSDRDSDNDKMFWNGEEIIEDRVILETEIKLKTGEAITMQLHEETVSNSNSEDDRQKLGIVRVLENDNEFEFFEEARRTPRKVRFGGEEVKMRTPESDSSNLDEEQHTLRITVIDALSVKTKKSLIPVRITSLPSTPRKQVRVNKRLHKSTPNLTRTEFRSKIPLKKHPSGIVDSKIVSSPKKQKDSESTKKDSSKDTQHQCSSSQQAKETRRSRKDLLSPTPHSEIEILHNLMRSPERKTPDLISASNQNEESTSYRTETRAKEIDRPPESYESFQIQPKTPILALPPPESVQNEVQTKEERFNSFQVVPIQEPVRNNKTPSPLPQKIKIPTDSNRKSKSENNLHKKISSPCLEKQQYIVEAIDNGDKENFTSFQVCPQQQILSLQPPPPSCSPDDGKERNKSKTEFNSFAVYTTETLGEEINGNISSLPSERNRIDISSFSTEDNVWNKSEALDNLIKMLKEPNTCESLEPGPASLLFEALFACQLSDKLHFLADDAIKLMVRNLRPCVLEQCLRHLALGICTTGAPFGVSLAMMIMERTSSKKLQIEIIENCFAHRMREGALQVLMAASRLLPSSEVEIMKITEFAAMTLRDKRRRVRHAALETLASLAQLSSNMEVLDIVTRITSTFQDQQYLLRVIRTRLSRRQLPSIETDGTIRYSTPRDQTEVDWLSGANTVSPPSSSTSSSAPSVNYWKRNSRHDMRDGVSYSELPHNEDGANGNQQIWAIDPSALQRNGSLKESSKGSAGFRPLYILQPETFRVRENGGRGRKKYDRGRSFSPHSKSYRYPASEPIGDTDKATGCRITGTGQQIAGQQAEINGSGNRATESNCQFTTGAGSQYASYQNLPSKFRQNEGVRKSFSSEQLFVSEKPTQEHNYYSLSSRSSNTSTGSSIRSGPWQKDMRSGIPIPIPPEKLRLRTGSNNNSSNIGVGPVIARRSVFGSPVDSPIITRLSPRHKNSAESRDHLVTVPPQSSGSESSGYFTPPSDTKQAFVKLDTEENTLESEDSSGHNDKNNNLEDFVDSSKEPTEFVVGNSLQRNLSVSSPESSEAVEEINETKIDQLSIRSIESEREELRLNGFSTLIIKESDVVDNATNLSENNNRSKSIADLHNFLPEINSNRKSPCSAPILKDNFIPNAELVISSTTEDLTSTISNTNISQTTIPLEITHIAETSEVTITRKLSRRLSRSQSKRSIKSTPRSIHETTPKSSRSANKPKETLQQALAQMSNPEWEVVVQGLQNLMKVAKYHPEIVEAQIHNVCVGLGKHIKNLRSQVARIACNAASELFASCRRGLDIELEEVTGPLLHRTADTNKFLRADANAALDVMCEHLPVHRVITVVFTRGCLHQNGIVRSASMRLLKDLAKRLGPERIFLLQKDIRDKLILAGANSLTDGSLEARCHGKSLFSCLLSHHSFQKALHEAVPQNVLRHIAKTLQGLRPCPSGT